MERKRDAIEIADARVRSLRDDIGRWRRTRTKRSAMPAELWAQAVELAPTHGTYRIARTVGVDYESLARRVAEAGREGRGAAEVNFVELRGVDLAGGGAVVEVWDADGARMTIRPGAGSALDATALVSAFRGRAR